MHYTKPVLGLSAIQAPVFRSLLGEYEQRLLGQGYSDIVVRFHLHSVAHFGVWIEFEDQRLRTISDETLCAFERHRANCACSGTSRNRARQVLSCVRGFLQYLRERGVVERFEARSESVPLVQEFIQWMEVHRGVVETTLSSYAFYVGELVRYLGDDPRTYTARGLRVFVEKRFCDYGRNSIRMVFAAVRMFLRYLAVEGKCRAGLEHALTPPANWSQQSLPRGLSAEEVERVLAACPSSPRGLRDRAVLLLLIRLGLRAGDVSKLRLSDLCFKTATIRVSGKGAREVRLPLPQDVGDALVDYLRAARPRVQSEFVFLRSIAPFKPFSMRQAGKGVVHIARAALKRAGVHPPKRGAHVFRHTAASQLLRQGVGVERIADVLRHRSVGTTGIYAKVDLELLGQVAQPWPEVARC